MTRLRTDAEIEAIAEALVGTCNSFEHGIQVGLGRDDADEDDLSYADCVHFDTLVFRCTTCEWWFYQSELHRDDLDEWICGECVE